jgi:hypothetical protein
MTTDTTTTTDIQKYDGKLMNATVCDVNIDLDGNINGLMVCFEDGTYRIVETVIGSWR